MTSTGGYYVVAKLPTDPSVVSPPIYDTAPLTIPVLQPGQAVVIQIPWYPPNPDNFTSFGSDKGHFCLLARIETSTTAPFGMDFPETTDINSNTKNNNKIVWKNVTVVDDIPGPMMMKVDLVRNIFDQPIKWVYVSPKLRPPQVRFLNRDAYSSICRRSCTSAGGKAEPPAGRSRAPEDEKTGRIEILSPDATIQNIRINPNETFSVNVEFALSKDYTPRRGRPLRSI